MTLQDTTFPNETELKPGEKQEVPAHMVDAPNWSVEGLRALVKGDKLTVEGVVYRVTANGSERISIKSDNHQMNPRHEDLAALLQRDAPKSELILVEKSAWQRMVEQVETMQRESAELDRQIADLLEGVNNADERLAGLEALAGAPDDAPREIERKQLITYDMGASPIDDEYLRLLKVGWYKTYEATHPMPGDSDRISHVIILQREVTPSGKPFVRPARNPIDAAVENLDMSGLPPMATNAGTLMERIAVTEGYRPSVFGRVPTPAELDLIALQNAALEMAEFSYEPTPLDSTQDMIVIDVQDDKEGE